MLPEYLTREIARRLSPDQARSLATSVGIDFENAIDVEVPQPDLLDLPERGAVSFELVVTVLGKTGSYPAMFFFSGDFAHQVKSSPDEPELCPDGADEACFVLVWPDGEPTPRWIQFPLFMIPRQAYVEICAGIRKSERDCQSNSGIKT